MKCSAHASLLRCHLDFKSKICGESVSGCTFFAVNEEELFTLSTAANTVVNTSIHKEYDKPLPLSRGTMALHCVLRRIALPLASGGRQNSRFADAK